MELQLRPALDLGPADAFGDDQGLAERMDVPGGAGSGLEVDDGAADARGRLALELAADGDAAGELFGRTLDGGLVGLAGDFHDGGVSLRLRGGFAAEQGGRG